ncbi:MAG: penicillin-binding protein [Elusimicrobia bacterium]|nr:penicillin-binding protein [Elusimicrobiota bacterium]MBD3411601.1 penicillin-binding protein [Elusimicrobiota bacterium]
MSPQRLKLLLVSMIVVFCALSARLYYLQVWNHAFYQRHARNQYVRYKNVRSLRGNILDRRGRVLSFSTFADSCYADPFLIRRPRMTAEQIAPYVGETPAEIAEKLSTAHGRFVWIKRRMGATESDAVRKLDLPGIGFIQEEKRLYPYGNLAGHVIGMLGDDNQPLSGIEFSAAELLSGKRITTKTRRDALGKEICLEAGTVNEQTCNVKTTIDRTIQYFAEAELERAMEETQAERGIVIVQDPHTGEILAMALSPMLELSGTCSTVGDLKNYAVSGIWEPGSTFKIVPVAALLQEKMVTSTDRFDCENGEFDVMDRTIHDHTEHGMLTVSEIVEQSSNIGMAKLGGLLGKEKMYYYTRAFGFGAYSGISLAGEQRGIFRQSKYWSGVSLYMLSFGQEIGVTPLQLIGAYSAIANGGYLVKPWIIKEIIDHEKRNMCVTEKTVVRKVLDQHVVEKLKDMLCNTVDNGTGMLAQVESFSVCGKTGTAQQIDKETREYSTEKYFASFCGFLPKENPRVCILVCLDAPKGVYWGGVVAAPVFARIAARTIAYLNVPPDRNQEPISPQPTQYAQSKNIN